MKDSLFIALQRIAPQHLLSRGTGLLANSENTWIKNRFIQWFANQYQIDMSDAAEQELTRYPTFNAFFTRALKPDARPIAAPQNTIVSPADGAVSQYGRIQDGRIIQAKGQWFSSSELLATPDTTYQNGEFTTIYLSPRDYHRVHMPYFGKLVSMTYVPGKLFSVNNKTAESVPRLFARNERVVCHFEGDKGPFAVVLVGAMIVASIETTWAGLVAPLKRTIKTTKYDLRSSIEINKGEEMGRFLLGSTVILLFPQDSLDWNSSIDPGAKIQMGQAIATYK